MEEKIKYSNLSFWLKVAVIGGIANMLVLLFWFIIGLIEGVTGGVLL